MHEKTLRSCEQRNEDELNLLLNVSWCVFTNILAENSSHLADIFFFSITTLYHMINKFLSSCKYEDITFISRSQIIKSIFCKMSQINCIQPNSVPITTSTTNRAGVRDPHALSGHRRAHTLLGTVIRLFIPASVHCKLVVHVTSCLYCTDYQ